MTVYTTASFLDKLSLSAYDLFLTENLISSTSGSGAVSVSSTGPRVWKGAIQTTQSSVADLNATMALIQLIQSPAAFFEFVPPRNKTPRADADGIIFGASAPTISVVSAGYTMKVAGLPSKYPLGTGDMISWSLNGVWRMHQIASASTTTAGLATINLVNPILTNAIPAVGTAVTFFNPKFYARYVPGSIKHTSFGPMNGGAVSFEFIQSVVI